MGTMAPWNIMYRIENKKQCMNVIDLKLRFAVKFVARRSLFGLDSNGGRFYKKKLANEYLTHTIKF